MTLRLALALALLASPALADLTPETAAAVDICTASGPGFDARIAALADAGWTPVSEATLPDAAVTLAPYHLILRMSVKDGQPLLERLELLTDSARLIARDAERLTQHFALMQAPDGATLMVTMRLATMGGCALAAAITPADLTSRTESVLHENTSDVLHQIRLQIAGNDTVFLFTYLPGTFGTTDPLPLLSLSFAIAN